MRVSGLGQYSPVVRTILYPPNARKTKARMMDIPLSAQVYGSDVLTGVFKTHSLVSGSWKVGMLDDPQVFLRSKCGHFVTRVHEPLSKWPVWRPLWIESPSTRRDDAQNVAVDFLGGPTMKHERFGSSSSQGQMLLPGRRRRLCHRRCPGSCRLKSINSGRNSSGSRANPPTSIPGLRHASGTRDS